MRQRDIASLARRQRQADTDRLAGDRLSRLSMDIEGQMAGLPGPRQPGIQCGQIGD